MVVVVVVCPSSSSGCSGSSISIQGNKCILFFIYYMIRAKDIYCNSLNNNNDYIITIIITVLVICSHSVLLLNLEQCQVSAPSNRLGLENKINQLDIINTRASLML